MPETVSSRLKNAWNAFMNRDPPTEYKDLGTSYTVRPDRPRFTKGTEQSIIAPIYNKIAMDCAAITIEHVKIDENGRYFKTYRSGLNNCLTLSANKDQTSRAFKQDAILSMFDEGVIALVPVDTTINPYISASYDIQTMRTAKIVQWYPDHVRIRLYNDNKGIMEELVVPKSTVAIIENPLYAIMNERNSIVQRLVRVLNLSDTIDQQNGTGKLDMIIQVPYPIKTEARRKLAEDRRKEIETQLTSSKYGIAYTDGTEHIIQLNRAVENNLMSRVEYLTKMMYTQLGITEDILNGTAKSEAMQNYYTRSIEPIIAALVEEMNRKFLTKTARTEGQRIRYFRDPFSLVPVELVADIADKFTRNEILSSNELRDIIGRKPVDNIKADELRNKNLNEAEGQTFANTIGGQRTNEPLENNPAVKSILKEKIQNGI